MAIESKIDIDSMTDEQFEQWLHAEDERPIEERLKNHSPAHRRYLIAHEELKKHPFDLDALVRTSEPQRCIVPFGVANYIERALKSKGVLYDRFDEVDLRGNDIDITYEEAQDKLIEMFDDPEAVIMHIPYSQESMNSYLDGLNDPTKDAFWTCWHEFQEARRIFDDEFDMTYGR